MSRKDFALIAAALADVERYVEEFPDPAGIGASTLRLTVDAVADRLALEYPRFDRSKFELASLPIQHERRADAIKRALGGAA